MRNNSIGDRHAGGLPLARTAGLVIQELPDETLVYDQERHRAHCLNRTAALVWKRCDGQTTFSAMEQLLGTALQVPAGAEAVGLVLRQLEEAHLLAEPLPDVAEESTTLSRRALLARIGVGVAAAVCIPLVTSIVAPTPARASSLKGTGANCEGPADCTRGICYSGRCE